MTLQDIRRTGFLITRIWNFRQDLVAVASMSASPLSVASDGFMAVFNFHSDEVMTCSVSDLLQETSPEVCQEVFWVFPSPRIQ